MIYPFKCECGNYAEIYRPAKDSGLPQVCTTCGEWMQRIFTSPMLSIKTYDGYNVSLGIPIKDKHSVKNELNRIKETTGRELIEMGNENPKLKPKSNYDMSKKEMREITNIVSEANG